MDVTSYIKRSKPELRMPKPDPFTGRDSSGIRFEGPVLSGLVGALPWQLTIIFSAPSAVVRKNRFFC
jgi:hypothetical protein